MDDATEGRFAPPLVLAACPLARVGGLPPARQGSEGYWILSSLKQERDVAVAEERPDDLSHQGAQCNDCRVEQRVFQHGEPRNLMRRWSIAIHPCCWRPWQREQFLTESRRSSIRRVIWVWHLDGI